MERAVGLEERVGVLDGGSISVRFVTGAPPTSTTSIPAAATASSTATVSSTGVPPHALQQQQQQQPVSQSSLSNININHQPANTSAPVQPHVLPDLSTGPMPPQIIARPPSTAAYYGMPASVIYGGQMIAPASDGTAFVRSSDQQQALLQFQSSV